MTGPLPKELGNLVDLLELWVHQLSFSFHSRITEFSSIITVIGSCEAFLSDLQLVAFSGHYGMSTLTQKSLRNCNSARNFLTCKFLKICWDLRRIFDTFLWPLVHVDHLALLYISVSCICFRGYLCQPACTVLIQTGIFPLFMLTCNALIINAGIYTIVGFGGLYLPNLEISRACKLCESSVTTS